MNLISIVIPTHNRAALLPTAIDSVLGQDYPDVEVLVVDDGSTDETPQVAARYGNRIRYISQDARGVAAARNAGVRLSHGKYIGFLDDDDYYLPGKLSAQARQLDHNPKVGMSLCRYYQADEHGNYLDKSGLLPEGNVLKDLLMGCFIQVHMPLTRREWLEKAGLFDEEVSASGKLAEDWDLWLRIARLGVRVAAVQKPLCVYRVQPGSAMTRVERLERGMVDVLEKSFSDPALPPDEFAIKDQAYAASYFWLSCRYYAIGAGEAGCRALERALIACPGLQNNEALLARLFAEDALSFRVPDPQAFIDTIFANLPDKMSGFENSQTRVFSRLALGQAFQCTAAGDLESARYRLEAAFSLDPHGLLPSEFSNTLIYYALKLPVESPLELAKQVFDLLPLGARQFKSVQSRVLSEVSIAAAFEHYSAGSRRMALSNAIYGLIHRPALLGNRGVLVIIAKSLFALP